MPAYKRLSFCLPWFVRMQVIQYILGDNDMVRCGADLPQSNKQEINEGAEKYEIYLGDMVNIFCAKKCDNNKIISEQLWSKFHYLTKIWFLLIQ